MGKGYMGNLCTIFAPFFVCLKLFKNKKLKKEGAKGKRVGQLEHRKWEVAGEVGSLRLHRDLFVGDIRD